MSVLDSSWSEEEEEPISKQSDGIHYYIQPVNEYENTVLTLYENYMESDGYQDPVCAEDKSNEKEQKKQKATGSNEGDDDDDDDAGYEIPETTETTLTYDILSNSPDELFLFVESLDP